MPWVCFKYVILFKLMRNQKTSTDDIGIIIKLSAEMHDLLYMACHFGIESLLCYNCPAALDIWIL